MPLWLDLLRTPMAAPETPALRRMRVRWQKLCLTCALCVGLFAPLHRLVGRAAAAIAATALFGTVLYTCLYLSRKHRIDRDHFERSEGAA